MLLIHCPCCDMARPEIEFRYAGEAHVARPADPSVQSDADWAGYLYMRSNPKGLHFERWHHVYGCARFFNVARDTASDRIVSTYKSGLPRPNAAALIAAETGK